MREIFLREENGNDVYIEVAMNAYAYSNKYAWLLSVFVKFDALNEEAEGFEEFLDLKESLIIALEHDEKAKYVGSRVVDGWSEFYFYAADSKGLDAVVTNILHSSDYVYESNVVRDTKWDFHYQNLAPSELELCHIQSEKIIFLLQEEGDNLEVQRSVEHYVSFTTPTQKNKFINSLHIDGFELKDEISSDEFEHGVALVKTHAVTSSEVKKVVNELFKEIKKEQGYYEGWSTVLAQGEHV